VENMAFSSVSGKHFVMPNEVLSCADYKIVCLLDKTMHPYLLYTLGNIFQAN